MTTFMLPNLFLPDSGTESGRLDCDRVLIEVVQGQEGLQAV